MYKKTITIDEEELLREADEIIAGELDELNRKKIQTEMEIRGLEKEEDNLSKERLEELKKELADLQERFDNGQARWQNEKAKVDKRSQLREEIETTKGQIEMAQQSGDLNKASELLYGKMPQLQKELQLPERRGSNAFLDAVNLLMTREEFLEMTSQKEE